MNAYKLHPSEISTLIESIKQDDYKIIGPRVRDGAIIYDEIGSLNDLPIGITDEQNAGEYRLVKRADRSFFGYNVGPQSWKKFLFPPISKLFSIRKDGKGIFVDTSTNTQQQKLAFIGVRPCELSAISIQDKIFLNPQFADQEYQRRRNSVLIVAVNCTKSGETCFCSSMKTGPRARSGYDVLLTEVIDETQHFFIMEVGSELGGKITSALKLKEASENEIKLSFDLVEEAAKKMGRSLDTDGLAQAIARNLESAHWDDVAKRCLACANCTLVCPTCFCSTVEDVTSLDGKTAERWKKWDSCFTMSFARVAGGNFRSSQKSRYRQWLTHKLSFWVEQFGTYGCVGCGRCITWCPACIDITQEAKALLEVEKKANGG
ncbi:MAG: 4Fe-4S dicluster domain-containing protein [Candidatus Kryptoniota bacterium]